MISGILVISLVAFIAVISYRRRRLEERVFKNIPLVDWLNILILPLFSYAGLVLVVRNILERPKRDILDFDDFFLLTAGTLFLVYAFVGNGLHFVGKVLSRYMPAKKHSFIFQINEMFHGKLSHYMVFVCVWMMLFVLGLLEANHPFTAGFSQFSLWLIIASAIIGGISLTKAVFYTNGWYGGYNKPLFFLTAILVIILLTIFKNFRLQFAFYPVNLFVVTLFFSIMTTFLLRRLLVVSRLGRKRHFRFLTRILSG